MNFRKISKKVFLFLLLIALNPITKAQDNFIQNLLLKHSNLFEPVLANLDSFEVQVIYTQIDRDQNNIPSFTTHEFNVNPKFYFYPASTVKFPVALLALEKINNLNVSGLNKFTTLKIGNTGHKQTEVIEDKTSSNNLPSIGHYIKKIFLVSDNDAYNRLYEFVGQREINSGLHKKGFTEVKIVHRFIQGLSAEENQHTNPFTFYEGDKIIYKQSGQYNCDKYSFELDNLIKGKGYLDLEEKLVNKPFDFTNKNYISLITLTEILKAVIFPEVQNKNNQFNLSKDDYKFLYKYMSMVPRESDFPSYDSTYYDSYVKFLMFGDSKEQIKNIRIFNKVGLAYGYLTDAAYIVDFENGIEFMLSAVIHVNKNKIYNDGIYEYDEIGIPFLANLGKVIYSHELKREKKYKPDLTKYKLDY